MAINECADFKFCEIEINFILKKIDENLETFTHDFPSPSSKNNVYEATKNEGWTEAFWTGMLWLAYEITGEARYRSIAEMQLNSYKQRIENQICTDTHDLGFLYSLSCVAAYKLTKNNDARLTALKAANLLMQRYHEKAGIIQAWGSLDDPEQSGRMIIDCCMNLPLLYWAFKETGNEKFYFAAYNHAKQSKEYIVRSDASTFHTYYMDTKTGKPLYGKTHQGYSDTSCWARGQAWAMYGFALSYMYTEDTQFLDTGKKVCNYFLNRLPKDLTSYWDLAFTEGDEERDSSAAAIAACGLMEMSKHLDSQDEYKVIYENTAKAIIMELSKNYTTKKQAKSNGILLHAVYAKPLNIGVDECCIWGDYFYFEGLIRIFKNWNLYW